LTEHSKFSATPNVHLLNIHLDFETVFAPGDQDISNSGLKGHRHKGTPILGQKGHGPRALLFEISPKRHRPRARDSGSSLLCPWPLEKSFLLKKIDFFGNSTGVAAIIFETNFRPKSWQSCTLGSSLMCSASHCIFGFTEMYFPDF
jgi:hypothetical protein